MLKRWIDRWRSAGARPPAAPSPAAASADAERLYLEAAQALADGRIDQAERAVEAALALRHDFAEALLLQGLVHKRHGRLDDAADSLLLAQHYRPQLAEVAFQLGLIASAQGRAAEAEQHLRQAVAADSRHSRARNALGAVLFKAGALAEAAACFRGALDIDPDYAQAHSNLGCLLLTRLDEWEAGAQHIETAWRLEPSNQDVMCNWAMLQQQRGRLEESAALWTRLAEGEDADKARLNRALVLLKQGNFARGWDDYEARKRTESEYVPRHLPFAEWTGESLAGRTILVHAEQGLGDQIMFASCLPDLARTAGHCVVEVSARLEPLFRRSFPEATVVSAEDVAAGDGWRERTPAVDCQVAIGSLPQRFRRAHADFPRHSGYLRADPVRVEAWRRRLAGLPGGRGIGISWRGGTAHSRRSLRSVPLAQWLPVFAVAGCDFVSLQYTDCGAELDALAKAHGVRVHHWQEAIDDYDETAALASALDLVISVQTAAAHLCGALGRPAWVLVPAVAEWRYLESGDAMPWYPSVRLWRQRDAGGWAPVMAHVADALERRVQAPGRGAAC